MMLWLSVGLGFAQADPTAEPPDLAALSWWRAPATALWSASGEGRSVEDRAQLASWLGDLRDPLAREPLGILLRDEDPAVRVAAAKALASTPGSAALAWQELNRGGPPPAGPGPNALEAEGERPWLVRTLGRQGGAAEVDRLITLLGEPWPIGREAALALGELGRREVERVQRAIPALVVALDRPDGRVRAAAAYGLRRIGMMDAEPALIQRALERWPRLASGEARAWLLRALWPAVPPEDRTRLFTRGLGDPDRLVRTTALQVAGPGVPGELLSAYLLASDPWVRLSAVAALGRVGDSFSRDRLFELADSNDLLAEEAWLALRQVPPEPDHPLRERLLARLGSRPERVELALTGSEARVRSAATESLLAEGAAEEAPKLLQAADPAVREGAVALLEKSSAEKQLVALVQLLAQEEDRGVLRAAFLRLNQIYPLIPKRKEWSSPALLRALQTPGGPATTAAARELASRLNLRLPEPPRELPPVMVELASGAQVEVATSPPSVAELEGLVGARVKTTAGDFLIHLDTRSAPYASALFSRLAEADFFDDRPWHRVIPGFVAQTGCPRGDGWGGLGLALPDELAGADFPAGSVGIARAEPDTGGTQWFVVTSDQPHLGGDYTRLGEVTAGLEVVQLLTPSDRVLDVRVERSP